MVDDDGQEWKENVHNVYHVMQLRRYVESKFRDKIRKQSTKHLLNWKYSQVCSLCCIELFVSN